MFVLPYQIARSYLREKDYLLGQRRVLLHEVNHRAKNSISMAIAMLRLQMGRQDKPEVSQALEDAIQRLDHLARIHENSISPGQC